MLKRAAVTLAFLGLILPATAGESGDILRANIYAGTLDAGLATLQPKAAGDQEARFGVGVLEFFSGIEHFTQALYRYGLVAPGTDAGLALSVPIPTNPNPEHLDYDKVRSVIGRLVDEMDKAKGDLVAAGATGDYVVTLDPEKFRIDINGDGKGDDSEAVGGILTREFRSNGAEMPAPQTDAPATDTPAAPAKPVDTNFGFDRADAIWLAGYSQVFAAQGDFFLAHDFSELVNSTFHRLFPRAGLPMQDFAGNGQLMIDPTTDANWADLIALIHTMNWPVIDAQRLKTVRERLKSVVALSRQDWDAIEAETDDNNEFMPSPKQTAHLPNGAITAEMISAWRSSLDIVDQILDGTLLLPHWRFKQGFDLKAYFETAKRTDLVMILTGYGALPFLRDGPVATADSFAAADKAFGGNLPGYALWFN